MWYVGKKNKIKKYLVEKKKVQGQRDAHKEKGVGKRSFCLILFLSGIDLMTRDLVPSLFLYRS